MGPSQLYPNIIESDRYDFRRSRRSRSRSGSGSIIRRGTITSSHLRGTPMNIDDEEEHLKKKLERKLRDKEDSYQKKLKQWESRERKKANEYEHEREHERKRQRDLQVEAQRLQEFFEDYDDNVEDPKYYRGSALHQRLKDREIEEAADERDRQKETEQLETARRKLFEEGDPSAESIIFQMEQKMQEHLKKRLNLNDDTNIEVNENGDKALEPLTNGEKETVAQSLTPQTNKIEIGNSSPTNAMSCNGQTSVFEPATSEEAVAPKEATNTFIFSMTPAEPVVRKAAPVFNDEDQEDKPKKHGWLPPSALKANSTNGNQNANGTNQNNTDSTNLPPVSALSTEERKSIIKRIIEGIPTHKRDLFAYPIEWSMVDATFINSRIKPWVDKKIISYIGEAEATLSNFICDQLLHHNPPERILADIAMVLDEEAEVFVVKMWRLLIYVISEKKAGLSS